MALGIRAAATALALAFAPATFAGEAVNTTPDDVAIGGYDPVAYHVAGRAMPGDPSIRHEWHDAIWQFASADNRERFVSDPDRYAPRFGGFCAGGVSLGRLSEIDPEEWVIVDGRLFLGGSSGATAYLMEAPKERIAAAEENWKSLGRKD